jgi:simple sugar transport system ATP-binding protein
MEQLVRALNIRKSFGGTVALDNVNFEVGYDEVVGLVGDNGAGKSTLIKILTGFTSPDAGEIYFKGKKQTNLTVQKARDLGIETVYQERALVEQQQIWQNIFLGRERTNPLGFLDMEREKKETQRIMKGTIGFTARGLRPESVVGLLSGGEKQGVAISRAMFFDADLVILDEPTIGLSLSETEKVLGFVRQFKASGKSCIFITHNVYHVYAVADRFAILDRGKNAADLLRKDVSLDQLLDKLLSIAKGGRET